MLAVILGLCAALSNAVASVLQRKAARRTSADEGFSLGLILHLARQGSWVGGIGALICGFVFQAAALTVGQLSLVQPLLALELPLTLIVAGRIFGTGIGRRALIGGGAMAAGLALVLFGLAPKPGSGPASGSGWLTGLGVAAGVTLALTLVGRLRPSGPSRAALLGAATGAGFGLTAALMKGATSELSRGIAGVFTSWQVYAMVVAGLGSLFLLQNALQSGTLVAAQPAITLVDPLASIALGVAIFHDQVRLGPWLGLELPGLLAIALGSIELARSPMLTAVGADGGGGGGGGDDRDDRGDPAEAAAQ